MQSDSGIYAEADKVNNTKPCCIVPGCDRPARTRGMCHRHYENWLYNRGKHERQEPRPDWPPGFAAKVKQLFDAGLSIAEIARRLGVTKNVISGGCYRRGWGRRFKKYEPPPNPFVGGCLWPHGHPDDPHFGFCGARPLPGKPYCAAHAAVAYIRPREEREAA
jgi:GcrA cell cycle regulator